MATMGERGGEVMPGHLLRWPFLRGCSVSPLEETPRPYPQTTPSLRARVIRRMSVIRALPCLRS